MSERDADLQSDDVAAQMLEAVGEDPRSDEGLQAEETDAHLQVALALLVTPPVALDDDGGGALTLEPAPVIRHRRLLDRDDSNWLSQPSLATFYLET